MNCLLSSSPFVKLLELELKSLADSLETRLNESPTPGRITDSTYPLSTPSTPSSASPSPSSTILLASGSPSGEQRGHQPNVATERS